MYVNFGEFISVRETLGECLASPYVDDAIFTKRIQKLGLNVVIEQQKNLVTPLFSVVATIVLAKVSNYLNEKKIILNLSFYGCDSIFFRCLRVKDL